MTHGRVALGVDVGGTFTDVVLHAGGELTTVKVPTTADQSEGVIAGVEQACRRADVDPADVDRFRHASTVATNALLEGEGAPAALVTTEGFADVLEIGRQDRPALYELDARKPEPLVPAERRLEVPERATPESIEKPLGDDAAAAMVDAFEGIEDEIDAVAVCFLHAYADPANERRAAAAIRDADLDLQVSTSHEVLGTVREYERTATTVADAVLTPVVDTYLGRLTERAADASLPAPRVMQSNGGIATAETVREHAVTTALSGPAAGVVGAATAEPEDAPGAITLDMGGTSCDVGLVRDGNVERTTEADVGGRPVRVPMVDIETVGAGGGSVAWVDEGGALRVGPRSAGADPGPACYGRGGTEPTVTDAALVLGYLRPGAELGGAVELDRDRAVTALESLADDAALEGTDGASPAVAAARGVVRVANARMAGAIRTVTVERGHDPRDFALVAFGGAGPMHAAAIAERLGVERVRIPPANGVLSALGLLAADEQHDASRTHRTALAEADPAAVEEVLTALADRVLAATSEPDAATLSHEAACRYAGQSHELDVPVPQTDPFDPAALAERFHAVHDRARGYALRDEPVELVTLRATANVPTKEPEISHEGTGEARRDTRRAVFTDGARETTVFDRQGLAPGRTLDAPAIIEGGESTVLVPPDWTLAVDVRGTLDLEVSG